MHIGNNKSEDQDMPGGGKSSGIHAVGWIIFARSDWGLATNPWSALLARVTEPHGNGLHFHFASRLTSNRRWSGRRRRRLWATSNRHPGTGGSNRRRLELVREMSVEDQKGQIPTGFGDCHQKEETRERGAQNPGDKSQRIPDNRQPRQ